MSTSNKIKSSINHEEVAKFSALSNEWWNANGPFKILHEINPIRLEYICSILGDDIMGMKILDAGCGGGLISLPLAKLGAKVDAIDASEQNIHAAQIHAVEKNSTVKFIHSTVEEHKGAYDAIVCLELIEHVENLPEFISNITARLKPGGKIIFSTLNRNLKSRALAIGVAEYILGWVPKNTHNYEKFVKPSELTEILEQNKIKVSDISGMSYNIIKRTWELSSDVSVNYFVSGVKQ